LISNTVGEVEVEDGVLVIKRIHVTYQLRGVATDDDRAKVDRVMGFHQSKCPVARSIESAIAITTELTYV
ncbi:MAG: OsmC family protein, partial [Acidimicrobiia bacterium]|nr:OsmC family protein [Acidimicrobiia bacterium]NNL28652.1 hypothetical protein [Acidimicrobiia bacterium]